MSLYEELASYERIQSILMSIEPNIGELYSKVTSADNYVGSNFIIDGIGLAKSDFSNIKNIITSSIESINSKIKELDSKISEVKAKIRAKEEEERKRKEEEERKKREEEQNK